MSSENEKAATENTAISRDSHQDIKKLSRQFDRVVTRAQAALFWERAMPKALPSVGIGAGFLTASWLGLWAALPPAATAIGALAFATSFVGAPFLVKTKSLRVTKEEALKRIDKQTNDPSRPAQTLRDKLAEDAPDMSQKLWEIHLNEIWNKWAGKFEAGTPRPNISKKLYGLGLATIMAAAGTGYMAGDERIERITDAFNWSTPVAPLPPLEVRAFITPPDNINREPLYLTQSTLNNEVLPVHENSILTINIYERQAAVFVNGIEQPLKKEITAHNKDKTQLAYQYEIQLADKDAAITIQENGKDVLSWTVDVDEDNNPSVNIATAGANQDNPDTIDIIYTTGDDHGVREGNIIIKVPGRDPNATPLPSGDFAPIPIR